MGKSFDVSLSSRPKGFLERRWKRLAKGPARGWGPGESGECVANQGITHGSEPKAMQLPQ